jgi:hypothetical protein
MSLFMCLSAQRAAHLIDLNDCSFANKILKPETKVEELNTATNGCRLTASTAMHICVEDKGKIKVKFTLEQATKVQKGSRTRALFFL